MSTPSQSRRSPTLVLDVRSHDDDAVILQAAGVVDMAAAPSLAEQFREIIRGRPAAVILDLTEVTFLATAGMSVFVETSHRAEQLSIAFRIVAAGPVTLRPMQLLGIDNMFALYGTVDEALESLRSGGAA